MRLMLRHVATTKKERKCCCPTKKKKENTSCCCFYMLLLLAGQTPRRLRSPVWLQLPHKCHHTVIVAALRCVARPFINNKFFCFEKTQLNYLR